VLTIHGLRSTVGQTCFKDVLVVSKYTLHVSTANGHLN
jgi:hypothetical protein